MLEATRVPNAPSYVDGVINLRGKVIPIIDLRSRFGCPGRSTPAYADRGGGVERKGARIRR